MVLTSEKGGLSMKWEGIITYKTLSTTSLRVVAACAMNWSTLLFLLFQ